MAEDARTSDIHIRLTVEERAFIEQKMVLAGMKNKSSYLRKMAMDGYVVNVDMSVVKDLVFLIRKVSNNVNQITLRANETGNIYAEDVEDIRKGYNKVWSEIAALLSKINRL